MGEFTAPVADHHIGFTGHRRVGGRLGEHGAENCIVALGGNTPYGISEIKIFGIEFDIVRLEVISDLLFEQKSDIFMEDISGRTLFAGR